MDLKTTLANPTGLPPSPGGLSPPAPPGAPLPEDHTQAILETTKHVAVLLKQTGRPFALAGSVADDMRRAPEDWLVKGSPGGEEIDLSRLVALREHYCDFGDRPGRWRIRSGSPCPSPPVPRVPAGTR